MLPIVRAPRIAWSLPRCLCWCTAGVRSKHYLFKPGYGLVAGEHKQRYDTIKTKCSEPPFSQDTYAWSWRDAGDLDEWIQTQPHKDEFLIEMQRGAPMSEQQRQDMTLSDAIIAGTIDPVECLEACMSDISFNEQTLYTILRAQYVKTQQRRSSDHLRATGPSVLKPIARIVLNFILADMEVWQAIAVGRSGALICYFALEESLDGLIENIIFARTPKTKIMQPDGKVVRRYRDAWRGILLGKLVKAHRLHGPERNVDLALRCFFRTTLRKQDQGKLQGQKEVPFATMAHKVSLWPAAFELSQALTAKHCRDTNADLYNHFLPIYEANVHNGVSPVEHAFTLAALRLYHPTTATSTAALHFLQRSLSDDGGSMNQKNISRLRSKVAPASLRRFLERTRQLALREGRMEDAAWVERQAKALLPMGWKLRSKSESEPKA